MRPVFLASLLAACTTATPGGVDDPTPGGDDGTPDVPGVTETDEPVAALRAGPSGAVLPWGTDGWIVVDADLGAVVVYDDSGPVATLPVGDDPTRIARRGDAWFVTLRGPGEVVRIEAGAEGPVVAARAHVGAEPVDVVGSAHRDAIYVALAQEEAVVALDPVTLQETDRWALPGQPRWLAAAEPGDDELVAVAEAASDRVHRITPETGGVVTHHLPRLPRFDDGGCAPRDLQARNAGGLAILPGTGTLVVGALYADTELRPIDHVAFRATSGKGDGDVCEDEGEVVDEPDRPNTCAGAYGCVPPKDPVGDGTQIGRFNPAVVWIDEGGAPGSVVLATGLDGSAPPPDPAAADTGPREAQDVGGMRRGYPSGLVVDADGYVWLSLESASAVVVVAPGMPRRERLGAFASRVRVTVPVPAGPAGVTFDRTRNRAAVWSAFDRRLTVIEADEVATSLATLDRSLGASAFADLLPTTLAAPASPLTPEVLEGRRLFFASDAPNMALPTAGVSCSSCHPDGRHDGFTWQFEDMPRSTPSIVGDVDDTKPLGWLGNVPDVTEDVVRTTSIRMGGVGLDHADAARVSAFVATLPPVVRPAPSDPAAVARGQAAFEAACTSCHAGETGTDGLLHAAGAMSLNTPALRGVAASGPWLHDGSARTLGEAVATAHAEGMAAPDPTVVDDVVAYLKTR